VLVARIRVTAIMSARTALRDTRKRLLGGAMRGTNPLYQGDHENKLCFLEFENKYVTYGLALIRRFSMFLGPRPALSHIYSIKKLAKHKIAWKLCNLKNFSRPDRKSTRGTQFEKLIHTHN